MKKALLIGIDYKNNIEKELFGCINDIVAISNILMDAFDYDKKNILMLREDSRNENKLPNRDIILNELNKLIEESKNLEEIWIHFSGHGTFLNTNKNTKNDSDKQDEIILPLDYLSVGIIKDDEIISILEKSKCKTVIVFDCCNSGSICDLPWRFEYGEEGFKRYQENNINIENKEIFMISTCRDDQLAVDGWHDENKISMGALTQAFIDCLRFNHYNVTFLKLLKDITNYMKQYKIAQNTTLSSSSKEPFGSLTRPHIHKKNDNEFDILNIVNFRD
jgi:hypothetical protein